MRRQRKAWGVNPSIRRLQAPCVFLFLFKPWNRGDTLAVARPARADTRSFPGAYAARLYDVAPVRGLLKYGGSPVPNPGAYAARLYDFAPFGAKNALACSYTESEGTPGLVIFSCGLRRQALRFRPVRG